MNILLITNSYPYGTFAERTFVHPEISALDSLGLLTNGTVNLYIAPEFAPGTIRGNIPSSVKIVDWFSRNGSKTKSIPNVLAKIALYKNILERALSLCSAHTPFINDLRPIVGTTITYCRVLSALRKHLPKIGGEWGLYTYWFSGATSACIDYRNFRNRLPGNDTIKWVITRGHGIDLYDDRIWHPRRKKDIACLDRVFPVSIYGRDYLVTRYGNADKIVTRYLGVHGSPKRRTSSSPSGVAFDLKIVSCAVMRPPKRIPLLCESVMFLSAQNLVRKVLWVHFGAGQDEPLVRETLLHRKPPNLTVELRGDVSNAEVRNCLRDNNFDCFVTLSESEGLPVSLQEAAEAGIPMVGTNVGGIPEIINDNSGILLPRDPTVDKVADAIELVTGSRQSDYRKGARKIWCTHFDAARNHEAFYQDILAI